MKNMLLLAIANVVLLSSSSAYAVAECSGYTRDKKFVTVHIETTGPTGIPAQGEVIFEKNENKFGYRFGREEITQFFENDEVSSGMAIVGAIIYVNKESPVAVKYVGPNFTDNDLKVILQDTSKPKSQENIIRVWRGPGHASTEQDEIKGVVCSVWSNI